MADIRPFRGLRYDAQAVGDLAAVMTPPYDVIDAAAQEAYYQRSPYNIIRLELGKQSAVDTAQDNRYTRAAVQLEEWLRQGVLRAEDTPAVYIYQQRYTHRGQRLTRTGFLAAMRLEEWQKGIVLPHEATMSGPKLDRLQLMRATEANFSPIFALYEDPDGHARTVLEQVAAMRPTVAFEEAGEEHRVWVVSDQALITPLRQTIGERPVYIADGHHRYETALHYRDERRTAEPGFRGDEAWNFVMTLLVDAADAGLLVLPTHRLVNPRRPAGLETLEQYFQVEALPTLGQPDADLSRLLAELGRRGEEGPVFGVYGLTRNEFALLTPRDRAQVARLMPADRAAAWQQLDVSVLHEILLRRVFGLGEPEFEDEDYVAYTRDEAAAIRAVVAGTYQLAVFLNPTSVRQVLAVARAGEVMPHKSTYFHPKPLTGIVLNRLGDVLG